MIRVATIVIFIKREDRLITVKLEIPGQSKVISGSLDRLLKLVKSQDCPGQPWTVGNYEQVGQKLLPAFITVLQEVCGVMQCVAVYAYSNRIGIFTSLLYTCQCKLRSQWIRDHALS